MDNKPNKLINEKSPYLLQHAYNPVDWYPWCPAAFEKAKQEDKPVFLSIGYSTCHWCHVMERESFEAEEVAEILNRDYVSIKVDREERPDIDHIYMKACQLLTGRGGWPLTILMTADRKPFFAGTYFSKTNQHGRIGLIELLAKIAVAWKSNRSSLLEHSDVLTKAVQETSLESGVGQLSENLLHQAYANIEDSFDVTYGGFAEAPKFPTPHNLMFLMRYYHKTKKMEALQMVEKTLSSMHAGGIYDHIGYGFARYSTDTKWIVPHFEKMLYDNALCIIAYAEAYQSTGKREYAQVTEEIIAYVKRDMTDVLGGFYSAEDADSEGIEGKFYVFSKQEVLDALGEAQGELFCSYYDITEQGNFMEQKNVMNYIGHDIDDFVIEHRLVKDDFIELLKQGREKLFVLRRRRIPPYKDDKILTAWNALMIVALSTAARALQNKAYETMAQKALKFIYASLFKDNRLLARYRENEAEILAYIDDYAFLLWALVELYETTYEPEYLTKAEALAGQMKILFYDDDQGGFFFTGSDGEALLMRHKEIYDGAIPSGNSVAALALQKLAGLTEKKEYELIAKTLLEFFVDEVEQNPDAYTFYLMALDYHLTPPQNLVVAGDIYDKKLQSTLSRIQRHFLPYTAVLVNAIDKENEIKAILPHISDKLPIEKKPTAYLCKDFHCLPPITDGDVLEGKLRQC